jgi:hypothetical protein
MHRVVSGTENKINTLFSVDVVKGDERMKITPEMVCDQIAMGATCLQYSSKLSYFGKTWISQYLKFLCYTFGEKA